MYVLYWGALGEISQLRYQETTSVCTRMVMHVTPACTQSKGDEKARGSSRFRRVLAAGAVAMSVLIATLR